MDTACTALRASTGKYYSSWPHNESNRIPRCHNLEGIYTQVIYGITMGLITPSNDGLIPRNRHVTLNDDCDWHAIHHRRVNSRDYAST